MIIWGYRTRDTRVRGGDFFCPTCHTETRYSLHRVARYFTLYFVPLFPISTLGEYITCTCCGSKLRPEVLTFSREQLEAATAPWACLACGNRNSARDQNCVGCGGGRTLPSARIKPAPRRALPPPLPGQAPFRITPRRMDPR